MKFKSPLLAVVLSSISSLLVPADAAPFQVARIFGDNMVLQQQQANPVWGQGTPGSWVRVELAGVAAETRAGPDGNWRVELPPLPAGGPHEMTVQGPESKHFKNVMIGEVWLASGQSNMDFRLSGAAGAPADIAGAELPDIRCLRVPQVVSRTPIKDLGEVSWQVCSPATAGGFSAVAFYFARALHRQRGVAVGIINATWSGTPAEAWTSNSALAVLPGFADRLKAIADSTDDWAAGQSASQRIDAERDLRSESVV